jgi:hypothetical protein
LAPPAPIGSLFKRPVFPRAKPSSKGEPRDEAYLALIRQLPCLSCGMEPCGEAAHIRLQSAPHGKREGMGRRPSDRWATPICGSDHREGPNALHKIGEYIFWLDLGINPFLIATKLYEARPDVVRMRAIVLHAIAERGADR